ncbi:hypothetical protein NQ317_003302 [Molorchus minor]|uniref:Ionotropic glutamate receptor C-terminal domain-containing protein n=1 Tax=Molorchus minor TaxID=1323400 RepID=A0ABQ9IZK3_9CUCU|nr:hypothetical protein NQ317_003302 [Molorchus minor]
MGLIEIVLAGLCLNATCPDDEGVIDTTVRDTRLTRLAEQLKAEHFRITTFSNGELSGYNIIDKEVIGTGVAFDIVDILKRKYNFNYSVIVPEENSFLSSANHGAKNLLQQNQADVAAAFLPVITTFRDDISYSTSFDTAEWVVLMKRPKESATGSGLLAPFTTPVWILIILSLTVVGPVIYLLIFLQSKLCKDDNNKVFPMPACIWFVYGALLKQGTTLNPVTDSSRLLFSTWWIFITILTAFYTANLTAFLTLSKFTLPINEPSDIKQHKYKWVTNKANGIKDYIKVENTEVMPTTTKKLVDMIGNSSSIPDVADLEILSNYVDRRDMMFIREKSVIKHVMYADYKRRTKKGEPESERCTYVVAKFPITTFARAFAYSKRFKYKELFDSTIQHLVESGIIQFKLKENLPDTEICPLNLGNTERRLRNSDLLLTYLIVGGGLVVAAFIFILELVIRSSWTRWKESHKPRKNPIHQWSSFGHRSNNNGYNNYFENPTFHTPPPSYHTLFNPPFAFNNPNCQKKNINGRDYWVIKKESGSNELIPLRTPSALLFQYSN